MPNDAVKQYDTEAYSYTDMKIKQADLRSNGYYIDVIVQEIK
jgi:hypothetical protein